MKPNYGFDTTRALKDMREAVERETGQRGPFCLVGDSETLDGLAKRVVAEHQPLVFPHDNSGRPDNLMGMILVPADNLQLPPGQVTCVPLARLTEWVAQSVMHWIETRRFLDATSCQS